MLADVRLIVRVVKRRGGGVGEESCSQREGRVTRDVHRHSRRVFARQKLLSTRKPPRAAGVRVKGPPGGKSEREGGTLIDRDAEEGRFFHLGFYPPHPSVVLLRYSRCFFPSSEKSMSKILNHFEYSAMNRSLLLYYEIYYATPMILILF